MGRRGSQPEPDADGLSRPGRYEWERWLRRCVLPQTVNTVGAFAAHYANRDGSRVYPGVARLVAVTGLSERSVRSALEMLRELQLLTRTRKGSSLGRQALTDEYELTVPADLGRRVHLLDPEESPASAACDPTCEHPGSPARRAAAQPVESAVAASEHRQEVPRTPASGAGTPAPHDRITGTTCTPPRHDHSKYQHTNQRDDSASLTEVQTARGTGAVVIPINRWGGVA